RPEIEDHRPPPGDDHVARFQVEVKVAPLVHVDEARTEMDRDAERVRDAEPPARCRPDEAAEGWSLEVLHQEMRRLPHTEGANDIRMGEGIEYSGLATRLLRSTKHLASHRTPCPVVPHDIDGIPAAVIDNPENGEV